MALCDWKKKNKGKLVSLWLENRAGKVNNSSILSGFSPGPFRGGVSPTKLLTLKKSNNIFRDDIHLFNTVVHDIRKVRGFWQAIPLKHLLGICKKISSSFDRISPTYCVECAVNNIILRILYFPGGTYPLTPPPSFVAQCLIFPLQAPVCM